MITFNCILQGPVTKEREHNKFGCFQKCLRDEENIRKKYRDE